jgi:hypothetical protein
MEGLSFVTPVTGLNIPNTGKDDGDDDDDVSIRLNTISYPWCRAGVASLRFDSIGNDERGKHMA